MSNFLSNNIPLNNSNLYFSYNINTIAGTSTSGYNFDASSSSLCNLNNPQGVCVDSIGNIYIADTSNHRIRFIPVISGTYFNQTMNANWMYTIAGTGTAGNSVGDIATSCALNSPGSVWVDSIGNIYIADTLNHRIKFIPVITKSYFNQSMTQYWIYTIAGTGNSGYNNDATTATLCNLYAPIGVSVDSIGNVYIADTSNYVIRFIPVISNSYFGISMTQYLMYIIAGTRTSSDSISGTSALLSNINTVNSLTVDSIGNVYIADKGNNKIKFIPITTGTYFSISMTKNCMYTIAGNGSTTPLIDASSATLCNLSVTGVSLDIDGNVYIADHNNNLIRFIPIKSGIYFGKYMTQYWMYTIAGSSTDTQSILKPYPTRSIINKQYGICVDSQRNIYTVGPSYLYKLYSYKPILYPSITNTYFGQSMTANNIYKIAGSTKNGITYGDAIGALATSQLYYPYGISVDTLGNVYIADTNNSKIKFIPVITNTYFGQSMTANNVYTIAGSTQNGLTSGDAIGALSTSQLYSPFGVSVDTLGNVYIADTGNNKIKFIPVITNTYFGQSMTANNIYTIAGSIQNGLTYGDANGALATSQLYYPYAMSVDSLGNLYIIDIGNHKIKFIPVITNTYFGQSMTANNIYTIAGSIQNGLTYGDANGALATSQLYTPVNISVDTLGNVYIADRDNNKIKFIPVIPGTYFGQSMVANNIYTIAGSTQNGSSDGDAIGALSTSQLSAPCGVSVDSIGNVYIADTYNNKIKFIPVIPGTYFGQSMTANNIYTIADSTYQMNTPFGISLDTLGNIYILQIISNTILIMCSGFTSVYIKNMPLNSIYTIAGSTFGDAIGALSTSQLSSPYGVSVDTLGNVYIADSGNHKIKFIPVIPGTYFGQTMTANNIYTILDWSYQLTYPKSVCVDSLGNVYFTDSGNHKIKFIPVITNTYFGQSMTANNVYTIAGSTQNGLTSGDAIGALSTSQLNNPSSVCVDSLGNVYIADRDNNKIKFIPVIPGTKTYFGQSMTANNIYTIAGSTQNSLTYGDTIGALSTSQLNYPFGVSVDTLGNVYIADTFNNKIKFIPVITGTKTYFGQSMTANNIYTIAGTPRIVADGDVNGALATSQLHSPQSVCVDSLGNVYIADSANHKIKFIPVIPGTYFGQSMITNNIYTIAGSTQNSLTYGDTIGALSTSQLYSPFGVSVDSLGNVYIADGRNNKIKKILTKQYYNNTFRRLYSGYKVKNNDALYYNQGILSLTS